MNFDAQNNITESGGASVDSTEIIGMAEKELAEDAQWKIFQKNTFTRWANEHIKKAGMTIEDLEYDLSDGLKLIALVEVLSGHKFRHVNKKAKMRTQKLENVTTVLKFLEESEGLRLVSIDSSHIVDSNLKLILGLMWALILHYSISVPMMDGVESTPNVESRATKNGSSAHAGEETTQGPRQRLLGWVKQKIPNVPVNNFTTDWNSGTAIGALVDACAPGLCPDWSLWDRRQALANATEAMKSAEDWLDIPQLIHPEEMIDPHVDEKAMMTYLSQYPNSQLKAGAPLRPKFNPALVRAYGPGLESNENRIAVQTKFFVETAPAGRGQLEVLVINTRGSKETCEISLQDEVTKTYACTYQPSMEGEHRIIIKYGGQEIPSSPFRVNIKGVAPDPSKAFADGPGIRNSEQNCVGRRTYFNVDARKAGQGTFECYIVDPQGRKDLIKPNITRPNSDQCYQVEYTPKEIGKHQVFALFAGKHISNSPFTVDIAPPAAVAALSAVIHGVQQSISNKSDLDEINLIEQNLENSIDNQLIQPILNNSNDLFSNINNHLYSNDDSLCETNEIVNHSNSVFKAKSVYALGRGIRPNGIRVQDRVYFTIHTENAGGPAEVSVELIRPDGQKEKVELRQVNQFKWEGIYSPQRQGKYILNIHYGDEHIQNSPFHINIGPYKKSAIRVCGPGIESGVVNYPNPFLVTCNGEGDGLKILIEGPSEAKVECVDNGNDSANVTYTVTQPGEYAVHVMCHDEDIPNSPFIVGITGDLNGIHPEKVRITGPGIDTTKNLCIGYSTEFYIEGLRDAVPSQILSQITETNLNSLVRVSCYDATGIEVPMHIKMRSDSTLTCTYKPTVHGVHTLFATIASAPIKGIPIRMNVVPEIQPEKVKIWGPGLQGAIRKQSTHFFIDAQDAFAGDHRNSLSLSNPISVNVVDDHGHNIPIRVTKQSDQTVRVDYTPSASSSSILVTPMLGQKSVVKSPIRIPVESGIDVSKIKVTNLQSTISANSPEQKFLICCENSFDLLEHVRVSIQSISDPCILLPVLLESVNEGITCSFHSYQVDNYKLHIFVDDEEIFEPKILKVIDNSVYTKQNNFNNTNNHNEMNDDHDKAHDHFDQNDIDEETEVFIARPNHLVNKIVSNNNNNNCENHLIELDNNLANGNKLKCSEHYSSLSSPTKTDVNFNNLVRNDNHNENHYSDNNDNNYIENNVTQTVDSLDIFQSDIKNERSTTDGLFHIFIKNTDQLLNQTINNGFNFSQDNLEFSNIESDLNLSTSSNINHNLLNDFSHKFDEKNLSTKTNDQITIKHYPPRPYITEDEKTELINNSKWPQINPEHIAMKIKATGQGLQNALVNKINNFSIDSQNISSTPLNVIITGPSEAKIQYKDNENGICDVNYTVSLPGLYTINIIHNNECHIEGSPYFVQIYPADKSNLNVDEVFGYGIGWTNDEVYKASYVKFTIDATAIDTHGDGTVAVVLKDPNNEKLACQVVNNKNGTYTCNYTPMEEGQYELSVSYEGLAIPGSPYPVRVVSGCDPTQVKAYGPGLQNGPHLIPNQETQFTVDLTGAGQGGLGLAVEGPSEAPISCKDNRDGTCTVSYTPTDAGSHNIYVRFNEVNVPGSPFNVNVKHKLDPKKVRCYGPGLEPGLSRAGWPSTFTVDTKNAGNATLRVMYSKKSGSDLKPAIIQPLGSPSSNDAQIYKVTYTPETEGPCNLEVTYDGVHVPGSPFNVNVRKASEPECVRVLGAGVKGPVLASLPATFTVDAREAGRGDLTLGLTDPNGQSVPVRVVPLPLDNESLLSNDVVPSVTSLASGGVSETGLLSCTFEPYLVGPHTINVMFAGVEVTDSPFTVQSIATGNADACRIKGNVREMIAVGQETVLTVDTSQGGKGRLTCQVTQIANGKLSSDAVLIPVETGDNDDGTTSVYYTPTEKGQVNVELRFGGLLIPNGKIIQKVVDSKDLPNQLAAAGMYQAVAFRLQAPRGDANFEASVCTPSGKIHNVPVKVTDNTLLISYNPDEPGMHELKVNVLTAAKSSNDTVSIPLQGSPYKFYVGTLGTGCITAHGPGLSYGLTSQQAEFTIVTKEAGAGGLSVSVEGPSKAEIKCTENSDGTCNVSYLPLAPGQYTIAIKFADQHIQGSPFIAKVTGDNYQRSHLSVGATSDIALEAIEEDVSTLTATVRSASGREETCVLKSLPNNRLGISFAPKEVGEHLVSVFQDGKHVANSPFRIRVSEKEIGDPERVFVSGSGLIAGLANEANYFTVDTRNAGFAGLSLSIEGPGNADINCQDNHDGTCSVAYTPSEPGQYVINVKYADVHVPNSPFYVEIGGKSSAKLMERIIRRREASKLTNVGSHCELSLRVTDMNASDLTATVTSPSGHLTPCEVITIDGEYYTIRFVPQETGEHLVEVKNKGFSISGSPFHFTVGPIADGVPHKVQAIGQGLQMGWTDIMNEFVIYTREAGAGTLSIAIEGPSKAEIDCDEKGPGYSVVRYRVHTPGIYTCSLKFNDEHIPGSPFRFHVADSSQSGLVTSYILPSSHARPIDVTDHISEGSLLIGRPIALSVHYVEIAGHILKAKVLAPSGEVEDAVIEPVSQDEFEIRFIPRESGPHLVHVHSVPLKDADKSEWVFGSSSPYKAIPGSPFRLVVSKQAADAGMVTASGDGLFRGKVGAKNTFLVKTTNAGYGLLNVTVDGPSKATVTSEECDEGYMFHYTPTVAGIYDIAIKYGGDSHIAGSPFKVEVTDDRKSRADLVVCQGSEVKQSEFGSVYTFKVDASDAGQDILLVGICGPKHASEEISAKHLGNNEYSVIYRVRESGKHYIAIKWGNEHIRGSPFVVYVP